MTDYIDCQNCRYWFGQEITVASLSPDHHRARLCKNLHSPHFKVWSVDVNTCRRGALPETQDE